MMDTQRSIIAKTRNDGLFLVRTRSADETLITSLKHILK
jgi:hypothetical protein